MTENEQFQRYQRASRTVAALREARKAMAEMPESTHVDEAAASLDQALADAEAEAEAELACRRYVAGRTLPVVDASPRRRPRRARPDAVMAPRWYPAVEPRRCESCDAMRAPNLAGECPDCGIPI